MQGGAKTNEVTIQAGAFTKLLGVNDLVVFLKTFRRNFNNLLRFCIGSVGNQLDVFSHFSEFSFFFSHPLIFLIFLDFLIFSRTV